MLVSHLFKCFSMTLAISRRAVPSLMCCPLLSFSSFIWFMRTQPTVGKCGCHRLRPIYLVPNMWLQLTIYNVITKYIHHIHHVFCRPETMLFDIIWGWPRKRRCWESLCRPWPDACGRELLSLTRWSQTWSGVYDLLYFFSWNHLLLGFDFH